MDKKILEKIVAAPAVTLDKTISTSAEVAKEISQHPPVKEVKEFWQELGPGLTTGAADDDPSGIATYSQAGAGYGFNLLWLAPFTFPLMAVVQEMCARIGLVTGRGLAANIRRYFRPWVLYLTTILLFVANTFNIGADLGAMASTTRLLLPRFGFAGLIVFFTLLCLFLQIFLSYQKYARYLKWLTLVLAAYILAALSLQLDWLAIFRQVLSPQISFAREQIFLVTGILGTTISPYLFFWQTSQEVEEKILAGQTTVKLRQQEVTRKEIKKMRLDVWLGMFYSNLIMFFIIVTCAGTLFRHGLTNIRSAADAAAALGPLAGQYASLLFSIGIIGVGLLAVPVLAGAASYAFAETFGWKEGLFYKLKQASAFYGVIIIAMFLGLLLNFVGLDPIRALIYAAVLNGLVAPVVLVLIVQLSANKSIMGRRRNHPAISLVGWITTGLMAIIGIATIVSLII